MAAKKKSDSSNGSNKPKNSGNRNTRAKKNTPKPKNEDQPKDPQVTDDDFGLDDIELEPVSDNPEDINTPEPIIDPVDEIEDSSKEPSKEEEKEEPVPFAFTTGEEKAQEKETPNEKPKKEEEKKDNSGIIILIVILILVVAAAIYFLVFKKKEPETVKPKIEQTQPVQKAPEPEPQPEPEPVKPKAELFAISAPDGRSYVVIGSFYDEDLAEDKAQEIVESGTSAYLLSPTGTFKFHRVGIAPSASMAEGEQKRSELVATYGENIWVLKY